MAKIQFTKMHGLGNDFIIIDSVGTQRLYDQTISSEDAIKLCDRRLGIGADQLLWIRPPQGLADLRMEIFNQDGSYAEMCGNGIRAISLYYYQYIETNSSKKTLKIETLAGIKETFLNSDQITVNMGKPEVQGAKKENFGPLIIKNKEIKFWEISVGNPHAVCFVKNKKEIPPHIWGPLIENHPYFPNRTNVEFVEITGENDLNVTVWERGAGLTLACGTGACAAAVAGILAQKVKSPVNVHLPGGSLKIEWESISEPLFMTGPAVETFHGTFSKN